MALTQISTAMNIQEKKATGAETQTLDSSCCLYASAVMPNFIIFKPRRYNYPLHWNQNLFLASTSCLLHLWSIIIFSYIFLRYISLIEVIFCQCCRYSTEWPFVFPPCSEIARVQEWASAVFYLCPVTSSIIQSITFPNKSGTKEDSHPGFSLINGTLRLYQLNPTIPKSTLTFIDLTFIFLQIIFLLLYLVL